MNEMQELALIPMFISLSDQDGREMDIFFLHFCMLNVEYFIYCRFRVPDPHIQKEVQRNGQTYSFPATLSSTLLTIQSQITTWKFE